VGFTQSSTFSPCVVHHPCRCFSAQEHGVGMQSIPPEMIDETGLSICVRFIADVVLPRYEAFCTHCCRRVSQIEAGTSLHTCESCQIAFFCPLCPQTHSSDECQAFQEMIEDEKWTIQHNENRRKAGQPALSIICTETPRATYLPLSAASGWYEYYTRISDKGLHHLKISTDLTYTSKDPMEIGPVGYLRYGSLSTTMPLTIFAALERLFPDLGTRTSISLHLIGANEREITRLMVFEELLHLLPSLKVLHITLVGLEIPDASADEGSILLECCQSCASTARTRSVMFYRGVYHDFIRTKHYERPDLAVVFQSGFSQESTEAWMPTIRHLAAGLHPTLFTTYNREEMVQETVILECLGAKFLQKGEVNQWKGLFPIMEPMGTQDGNVYYFNQYCYIVTSSNM
jgi:splicing suppressor protein 51